MPTPCNSLPRPLQPTTKLHSPTHPHAIAAPCRHHHHHPPNPLTTTHPFPPTTSPYHTIPYCTPPTIPLIPPYHIQTRSIPLHHTHQNLPQPPLTPPPPHPHAFAPLLYHTQPPKPHPDPTHPPVFLHPSYHTLPQITKQPHNPTTRPHSLSMPSFSTHILPPPYPSLSGRPDAESTNHTYQFRRASLAYGTLVQYFTEIVDRKETNGIPIVRCINRKRLFRYYMELAKMAKILYHSNSRPIWKLSVRL